MVLVIDGVSHILEVDESIANTRTKTSVKERSAAWRHFSVLAVICKICIRNGQSASSYPETAAWTYQYANT